MNRILCSTGNADVGAFMRALGYGFRPDVLSSIDDQSIFKKAQAVTNPERNLGASLWGRALAEACHAKLQEWQDSV